MIHATAIIDPGAMVIHVEHASVAGRAVMAALGLEHVAHEAVPAAFVLWVSQMEAPEHRHLAWISGHGLEEGPKYHEEQ